MSTLRPDRVVRCSAGDGEEAGGASIFEDLMGRVRSGRPGRGVAAGLFEAHLSIPFLTAVEGGETTIEGRRGNGKAESLVVEDLAGRRRWCRASRTQGQGEPGARGRTGDLTITIEVEPHSYYKRDGQTSRSRFRSACLQGLFWGKDRSVRAWTARSHLRFRRAVPADGGCGSRDRNCSDRWQAQWRLVCRASEVVIPRAGRHGQPWPHRRIS